MSAEGTCPACAMGEHDHHDAGFGIIEGVIGGTYCGCGGDCAEVFAASARWARRLFESAERP